VLKHIFERCAELLSGFAFTSNFNFTGDWLLTKIILIYLAIINITSFYMMWLDKRKARKKQWRIAEGTLFTLAVIGGSIGVIAGMWTLRHKTKHKNFIWGMPLVLVIQFLVFLTIISNKSKAAILFSAFL